MKKSLLFALSLSAMLVACGGNEKQEPAVEAEVQEAGSVECVASGDVVFIATPAGEKEVTIVSFERTKK